MKSPWRVTQGQQGVSLEPPSLAFGAFQGSLLSAMLTSPNPGALSQPSQRLPLRELPWPLTSSLEQPPRGGETPLGVQGDSTI